MTFVLNILKYFGFYPSECTVDDCKKDTFAKALCRDHYRAWVALRYPSSRDLSKSSQSNQKQETK